VLDHLPERDRPQVKSRLRRACTDQDHDRALEQLRLLANELERSHPDAAASLREGLPETLAITRLGVKGRLRDTLRSTNPYESMIETVRRTSRNVKRWQSGEICLRWTSAGCSKPSGNSAGSSATATSPTRPRSRKPAPTRADHGGRDLPHMR
jgi:putative transposase